MAVMRLTRTRLLVAYRLLALAFKRAGVGLCLVGSDNGVITANARWLNSAGLTADQAVGVDIQDLLPAMREPLTRARTGETVEFGCPLKQLEDGREEWWEGTVAPIPLGRATGLLITVREVSAPVSQGCENPWGVRSMEEPLEPTPDELRGLLVSIRGHADAIRRAGGEDLQIRGSVEKILSSAAQMEIVIGELEGRGRERPGQSKRKEAVPDWCRFVMNIKRRLA